jgi:Flp pilus assembly protein TadG
MKTVGKEKAPRAGKKRRPAMLGSDRLYQVEFKSRSRRRRGIDAGVHFSTSRSMTRSQQRYTNESGLVLGNKSGVAIIEFTIILPLLVLFLIPMIDFGRVAYFAIEVSSAARAGAQFGAQSATTAQDSSGMQTAATNDALEVPGWQTPTATSFCQCSGSTVDCSSSCSGSSLITYVQVNTRATVSNLLPFPGLPASFNLSGQAIMRVLQ